MFPPIEYMMGMPVLSIIWKRKKEVGNEVAPCLNDSTWRIREKRETQFGIWEFGF